MEGLEAIVEQKYGTVPRPGDGPYEDDLFEQVVDALLNRTPAALGEYVGTVLATVQHYGDECGWDTAAPDAQTFLARFEEGFRHGLATPAPEKFPEREQVIAAFEAVIGDAHRAIPLQMLTS